MASFWGFVGPGMITDGLTEGERGRSLLGFMEGLLTFKTQKPGFLPKPGLLIVMGAIARSKPI